MLTPKILPGVAIDFTSLPVVIAGFFGGAIVGLITGLIAGIIPGIYFGFIGGILGIMGPISLMLGKAISGFTIGFLSRRIKIKKHPNIGAFLVVILGFIPEAIWITVLFLYIVPFLAFQGILASKAATLYPLILVPVLSKATFEFISFALITSGLSGNAYFIQSVNLKFNLGYYTEVKTK
ncbi:MAG: LytS/YhcK type 5TM receptor domain-containing protein [Thermoproteota archaeon]|nr:LytS/YhcK type 5TM receptor domain-containing protein [Thermoproteota archaeon]